MYSESVDDNNNSYYYYYYNQILVKIVARNFTGF